MMKNTYLEEIQDKNCTKINILETHLSLQNPGMQFLWLIFRYQDDFIALTAIIGTYYVQRFSKPEI